MGHAPGLTEHERGQIDAFKAAKMSTSEIAERMSRSRSCISRYLKSPDTYGNNYVVGRPPKLTERDKRQIYRMASEGIWSAAQIQNDLKLDVSVSTITRALNSSEIFKFVKSNRSPMMTQEQEVTRVKWAVENVDFGAENWKKTIFSDEKKWNLDGPDGLRCYWHDLRKEKKTFFSRQNGGGSVMVSGTVWADGTTKIAFTTGKQCAKDYIYTLSEYLLPAAHLRFGTEFIFQQDNASIHTAHETKGFFEEQNVDNMTWPVKSPDVNPIENVWGYVTRRVYAGQKQYRNVQELKLAILREWEKISQEIGRFN